MNSTKLNDSWQTITSLDWEGSVHCALRTAPDRTGIVDLQESQLYVDTPLRARASLDRGRHADH